MLRRAVVLAAALFVPALVAACVFDQGTYTGGGRRLTPLPDAADDGDAGAAFDSAEPHNDAGSADGALGD